MPAPRWLAFLPKPMLFGLYGAIGGLLGALVFGEPAWYFLRPPPPPPAVPEPQVAVSASRELQLLQNAENSVSVEVARADFTGPVTVDVLDLPPGVTSERITIPPNQTSGRLNLHAAANATPAATRLSVSASASFGGKTLTDRSPVNLQVIAPASPQADVFFVLDVTSSMRYAINGVRDGIGAFAATMRDHGIDYRIGLLAFRDLTIFDAVPMDLLSFGGQPFTTDVDAFRSQVGRLEATGGDDIPESSLEAIERACQQPFRKGATKVLLLITDAPPKVKPGQNIFQTEAEARAGAEKAAIFVRDNQIDAVHLVVRRDDFNVFEPLMQAGSIKGSGQFFDLNEVATGTTGFNSLLDKFTSEVVRAAAARNPTKPVLAEQAGAPVLGIRGVQSSQSFAEGTEGRLVLAIGVWTGAIAALVCLVLLAGQHHYLRGSLPNGGGVALGLAGGLMVGIIGGAAGQGLYLLAPNQALLTAIFRVFGWAILGGLAGVGLSLFIPNLKSVHGLAGGAIGGAIGALGYMTVNSLAGDVVGRLVGGLILGLCIGVMVALVEAAFRRAWLEVRYGSRETITVNLGPEPVKIGGDNRACTVWARGAAPIALRYFIRGGEVVCEDAPERTESIVRNGDSREVGTVTVTVRTGNSSTPVPTTSRKPTAAPPLKRTAAPVPTTSRPMIIDSLDDDPLPLPISPPVAPPRPAPKAALPVPSVSAKPSAKPPGPRDPDACPSCGRKNPGRPGSRYCMMCDQSY